MSKTRKVIVKMNRYYSKQVSVEIDVDENIKDDELQDYLTENEDLDSKLKSKLSEQSLIVDEDTFEFQDPTNNFGGHL
jgi:hypothetical protein